MAKERRPYCWCCRQRKADIGTKLWGHFMYFCTDCGRQLKKEKAPVGIYIPIRELLVSFLLLLALLPLQAQTLTGRVVRIADGDTFTLLVNERDQYRVRLDGIDAPEKAQAYGRKSKQCLSDMIWGKSVTIYIKGTDRYGRYIAKVSTPDIEDVNLEMLKAGMAWHYKEYNQDREYSKAEAIAIKKGIGLWQDSNPIKPSDFRKEKKTDKCIGQILSCFATFHTIIIF